MIIYIFGNLLLDYDNLPLKLKPELEKEFPGISFVEKDPSENLHPKNKKLIIIDTVEGIKDIEIITDIDKIKTNPIYSLHDFDLGMTLRLLQEIGDLEEVLIFGVPAQGNKEKILKNLINALNDSKVCPTFRKQRKNTKKSTFQ